MQFQGSEPAQQAQLRQQRGIDVAGFRARGPQLAARKQPRHGAEERLVVSIACLYGQRRMHTQSPGRMPTCGGPACRTSCKAHHAKHIAEVSSSVDGSQQHAGRAWPPCSRHRNSNACAARTLKRRNAKRSTHRRLFSSQLRIGEWSGTLDVLSPPVTTA